MPELQHRTTSPVVGDRYILNSELGRGGRATVWSATDTQLDREVAVKVFHADASLATDAKVQEAEARLAARMNHHALITLFDAGVDSTDAEHPQAYLVMEHVPGVDLRRRLREHGPLTPGQVACLGHDLSEALKIVHEHGFLHRDIKPANVLIADRDVDTRPRAKLTDFGIATVIGLPEPCGTSGTAAYLSPEQVDGQQPTTASDVYCLGLVLLEALTGRVEFPGGAERSAVARLARDPEVPSSVPEPIASIVRRMTRLLPEERPDLAEVVTVFLGAFVQHLVEVGRVAPHLLAADESGRLTAVSDYRILDTPADAAFDRVTKLACRMLDVPVSLVAIVDADRAWFKSKRGMDVESVDRNVALCAATITSGLPIIDPDVQSDPARRSHPVIQADPSLHAFASVPLLVEGGYAIGTLSVFDARVRDFTEEEVDDLRELAAIAVRELDLRLAARRAVFAD